MMRIVGSAARLPRHDGGRGALNGRVRLRRHLAAALPLAVGGHAGHAAAHLSASSAGSRSASCSPCCGCRRSRPLALARGQLRQLLALDAAILSIFWFYFLVPMLLGRPVGGFYVGADRLHPVRGGLLLRDHPRRHPERAAGPDPGRARARPHHRAGHALVVLPQALRNMLPVLLTQRSHVQGHLAGLRRRRARFPDRRRHHRRARQPTRRDVHASSPSSTSSICFGASAGSLRAAASEDTRYDRARTTSANGMAPSRCLTIARCVAKGEVVVVCGPSGSGKSTLIKCINGLEPFQKGTITVDGIRSATARPTCRSCARASAWCSRTSSSTRT